MIKNFDRYDWTIYSNDFGGWFAWDHTNSRRVELVDLGRFSEAVAVFEQKIGPFYLAGHAPILGDEEDEV